MNRLASERWAQAMPLTKRKKRLCRIEPTNSSSYSDAQLSQYFWCFDRRGDKAAAVQTQTPAPQPPIYFYPIHTEKTETTVQQCNSLAGNQIPCTVFLSWKRLQTRVFVHMQINSRPYNSE